MSELSVGQLKGLLANNNVITVPSGHQIYAPGSVVQVQVVRSGPTSQTISSQTPVAINGLSISFTPKFATSRILIQAQISTSATYVSSFGVFKDGLATVSTTGVNNSNEPNMQITTYFVGASSTPDALYSIPVVHFETALSTTARTYDVRATSGFSGVTYDLRINNRGDGIMSSFSHMVVTEIAQ
jgi:hypothetical protein